MPYLRFATEIDPVEAAKDKTREDKTEALEKFRQERRRHIRFLQSHNKDIVHGSRTLDEFYYQHLVASGDRLETADQSRQDKQKRFANDMRERNHGQVASRYFYGEDLEQREHWDILRVDQLWMWIIDESESPVTTLLYTRLWIVLTNTQVSRDNHHVFDPSHRRHQGPGVRKCPWPFEQTD